MIGALMVTLIAPALHAEISFEPILTEQMDEPVLDMVTNPDEGMIFFLTPSAVLLYSANEKGVIDRIPLKDNFDRIGLFGEDQLILTRSHPSWVQIIQYSRIFSIDVANRAFKGQVDAKATIVVFDDYQCPYCARLERFVEQVLEQFPTGVKYVIKHFPLSSHAFAHNGAMAALAAGKQGKFWEFHSRLLENHDQVNEQKILDIAGELKLDMERFKKDRQSASSRKLIQEDIKNGRAIGVSGPPSAFINGKRIRNQDLGRLPELIIRELGDS
jgi:predicted DsbA family dithiol-disulfide isomerase